MTIATPFALDPIATPTPDEERARRLVDPGFGRVFTDHMAIAHYSNAQGWHDLAIGPRRPLTVDPACAVLHYAQEIFEGLKAYRTAEGGTALFRPEANARRFQASARRLAMPELPEELFIESCRAIVRSEADWIPSAEGGSLYLRPFMIASEAFLGVKPSSEYIYMVIASSVGAYFKGGPQAVTIWASETYTRAAPGGTGAAKCGGNYAASLAAQAEATGQGCAQVVFLDAIEHRYVEELGGMNIFFVFDDGSLATPPLSDTILAGITRDSLMTIARDRGIAVREERYSLDQWRADAASGRLAEAFACGTAAVVTPIAAVKARSGDFTIGSGEAGKTSIALRQALVAIQTGEAPDDHGWLDPL
ncbi:branched-chain amino acid aminotransferase [Sphingomonas sp.]|jgi:branched-chain amino acid aminotransferase|uniref:branched-chain amino acid aminotransferase n=1 Tax=Sphingomonas sp. TaxID=28214 RepID=UPI002E2FF256|nr:branched-chain amino acid aminotransferase [Sphingomonas sp.]HEX4695599.1 branched-chain amino acid aminotransferase [Sphingomonas sp.]